MTKNIVLLQCAQRSGHFGQGSFANALLPYFKNDKLVNLTIAYTDSLTASKPFINNINGVDTISIPPQIGLQRLTGEDLPAQKYYAVKLAGILYEYLRNKPNLILWVNTIDFLNVCSECKILLPKLKIFYVHHSFSWKYMLNIPDESFEELWVNNKEEIHPKAFEMTRYQQKMALLVDKTITVTKQARKFFEDVLGIPAGKIQNIYNGLDHSSVSPLTKEVLRKKYGFKKSDKILIVCGRITKDKGIPDLLKAFQIEAQRNTNLKLVIIGAGYISEFAHLASPCWSRVVYTGELNQPNVYEFYKLADIGIIPSLHEQCSFTAIEMILNKLPLIVSDVDGLRELFDHELDVLKIPIMLTENGEKQIDIATLALQINLLVNDLNLAERLSHNCYQKAMNLFSLTRMHENYGNMIDDLLI